MSSIYNRNGIYYYRGYGQRFSLKTLCYHYPHYLPTLVFPVKRYPEKHLDPNTITLAVKDAFRKLGFPDESPRSPGSANSTN